jgi:hypothetical protein
MNTSLKKIQKSAYYLRILPAIDRLIKHEELSESDLVVFD